MCFDCIFDALQKVGLVCWGDASGNIVWGIRRSLSEEWPGWAVVDALRCEAGEDQQTFFRLLADDCMLQAQIHHYYKYRVWGRLGLAVVPENIAATVLVLAADLGVQKAMDALCKVAGLLVLPDGLTQETSVKLRVSLEWNEVDWLRIRLAREKNIFYKADSLLSAGVLWGAWLALDEQLSLAKPSVFCDGVRLIESHKAETGAFQPVQLDSFGWRKTSRAPSGVVCPVYTPPYNAPVRRKP